MTGDPGIFAADAPPSPSGGWSCSYEHVSNAILVPPVKSDLVQECGVLDADGSFCASSATWRGRRQTIIQPPAPKTETKKLSGRHLYCGQIWSHFGHFMAESLSRLWALDQLGEQPTSLIFLPKRPNRTQGLHGYQKDFLRLLQIDIPVQIIEEPTEVEELIVPGQGFGLGAIAAGTDPFRAFFTNRFATDVKADGPEGLYLSRSALKGMEGSALHEEAIETSLSRDGIATIHPQELSLEDQIARYRAAKRIVSLDGSALHLFGFVGQSDQRVGIILRRNSKVFESIRTQIRSFCDIEPVVYDAIAADWIPEHKSRPGRYSFGEIDFPVLARLMHETGFGPEPETWDIPRFRDMKRVMRAFSDQKGVQFNRVKKPGRGILTTASEAAK
jgi:hypothetical protein